MIIAWLSDSIYAIIDEYNTGNSNIMHLGILIFIILQVIIVKISTYNYNNYNQPYHVTW